MSEQSKKVVQLKPAEKKENRFLLFIKNVILYCFVCALAFFALLYLPVFDVSEIYVTGCHELECDDILALSGLETGVNIFKADTYQAGEWIDLLPWVRAVKVKRELPSSIIIEVEEQEPRYLVPAGTNLLLVSTDGTILGKRLPQDKDINYPILTGVLAPEETTPGSKIEGNKLDQFLDTYVEFPIDFREKLAEFHLRDNGEVVLYTKEGIELDFGSPRENMGKKIELIQKAMEKTESDIVRINVRSAERAHVSLRNNGLTEKKPEQN